MTISTGVSALPVQRHPVFYVQDQICLVSTASEYCAHIWDRMGHDLCPFPASESSRCRTSPYAKDGRATSRSEGRGRCAEGSYSRGNK